MYMDSNKIVTDYGTTTKGDNNGPKEYDSIQKKGDMVLSITGAVVDRMERLPVDSGRISCWFHN